MIALNLKDVTSTPRVIVGLQGPSGTGKSYSALTFPNPIVLDFDDSLTAHAGKDVRFVPFHNAKFIEEQLGVKRLSPKLEPFKTTALMDWLKREGPSLLPTDTLILDSWTTVQNAVDQWTRATPAYTKQGQIDDREPWARKMTWSCELLTLLKTFACNIVVTFHETQARDNVGNLLDKVAPFMQGSFAAQLKLYFSDWFRTVARAKKSKGPDGKDVITGTDYFWQIKSDNQVDLKTRLTIDDILIEPNYKVLEKHYGKAVTKAT